MPDPSVLVPAAAIAAGTNFAAGRVFRGGGFRCAPSVPELWGAWSGSHTWNEEGLLATLDGRAKSGQLTVKALYDVATLGDAEKVRALLSRVSSRDRLVDPLAIGLRATDAIIRGEMANGLALFGRAISHGEGRDREYLTELMVPYLISNARMDEAATLLAATTNDVVELRPAFDALRAIVAAQAGRDAESRTLAAQAVKAGRLLDVPVIAARILQRAGLAAFFRDDFDEAQELALEAAQAFQAVGALRQVCHAYSLLYVITHECIGDPELTRLYAERMTVFAQRAGDVAMQNNGFVAQLEIAAQSGDVRRLGSIRSRLLANPRSAQYRERFAFIISEALLQTWAGQFTPAYALLQSAARATDRTLHERALCHGFMGLLALARGDEAAGRQAAQRVIGQTAHHRTPEALHEARTRRVARIVAACTSILAGDVTRGRRALSSFFDPDGTIVELADRGVLDENHVPPMMRGLARAVTVVQEYVTQRKPKHTLTETEVRTLQLLLTGDTLESIAGRMGRSVNTVKGHVKAIYEKLDVSTRAAAVRRAREVGIES